VSRRLAANIAIVIAFAVLGVASRVILQGVTTRK
jgi:hypothetical protein